MTGIMITEHKIVLKDIHLHPSTLVLNTNPTLTLTQNLILILNLT